VDGSDNAALVNFR